MFVIGFSDKFLYYFVLPVETALHKKLICGGEGHLLAGIV
jgi:hypothetical protein